MGSVTSTLSALPGPCGGAVTETWTYTDACNRTITQTRVITVSPAPVAVFAAAPPITVACGAAVTSDLTYTNGATGSCLISGSVTSTLSALPGPCGGAVTETWTFTDACSRTITASRVITVSPAPAPVFAAAPPITVACGAAVSSSLGYTNSATGSCLISGSVTSTLGTLPGPCGGTITETWTYTDACNRTITASRVITVSPAPAPVFAAAPPITVACGAAVTSSLGYTNSATGSCLISGSVTSTLGTLPGPCGGTVTETWTYTDACNRTITQTRVITVSPAPAPTFTTPPADITVACGAIPAVSSLSYSNGASGSCLISGSVTSTQTAAPGPCGGTITETWTFTDACSRTITASRVITVSPAPAPVFAAAPPITVACGAAVTSSLGYTNSATGSCLISGSVTSTLGTLPGPCGGTVTETWTYTDACNRTITQTRVITVSPAPAPTFTTPPADITVACGAIPAVSSLSYSNGASGSCLISGSVTSTQTAAPGPCGGTITETWTFTDACSRTITASRVITVSPAPAPVFAAAPPITVACGAAVTSSLGYTNSATGSCLISGSVTSTLGTLPGPCGGTVTETWTYTDACNRTITQTRVITVSPAPAPTFTTPPADITVACGAIPAVSSLSYSNGASGSCLISGSVTSTQTAAPGPCGGTITETWTFTDACSRTITASRVITVSPAPAPVFAAAPPITVACGAAVSSSLGYTNSATGSCLISGSVTSTLGTLPGPCGGTVTETWTYTDACNRTITQTRVITVSPAPAPTFTTPPADITVACGAIPAVSSLSYSNGASGSCLISGSVTSTQTAAPG